MKIIFGSRFSRAKSPFEHRNKQLRFQGEPARRGWKRTIFLVLVPVSLFAIAMVDHGNPAIGKVIRREIIAALEDPFNLIAERSPGGRGPGVLLSIKGPIKGPHERVLSTVRERETPPSLAPAGVPQAVASIPIAPPEYDTPPQGQIAGTPPFSPFFPTTPFGYPYIPPSETPTPPPGGPVSPPGAPGSPPGTPGSPPGTVVIVVPEPATWAMMILGLFAIGMAPRRRMRKQADPTCKQQLRV